MAKIRLGRVSLATARLRSTFTCLPGRGQAEWLNSGSKTDWQKVGIKGGGEQDSERPSFPKFFYLEGKMQKFLTN